MKMTIAVTNLRMYVSNLGLIWMTIMLGLSESSSYVQFNESIYRVPCNEGWYLYGEKCYGVMGLGSELSWKQASDKCVLEHGNLATIYSQDLQEFLTAFVLLNVKEDLWIGLHDRDMEGFHQWADGSPLDYRHWDTNEPTGRRNHKEDCVEMRIKYFKSEIGTWNDEDCEQKIPYLCQADKDINTSNPDPRFCSLDEIGGWKYLNSCYHIVQEKMTWEEAECFCQEIYGGHLLKILDSQTQIYINYILSNQSMDGFWIGIQIKKQKLQRWSSGWEAVYTNWDEEHQDFSDGTCAVVTPKKTWSSAPCFKQHTFICETSKVPPKSDQENQTQCQTILSKQRDSSKSEVSEIKRGISLKTVIGISLLIVVLCVFIGVAIHHYMKSYIPGFRSKKNRISTEALQTMAVQYEKI